MNYINGKDLRKSLVEKGKLELDQILEISEDILPALSYMHNKKLIHRDLKPANIMIEEATGRAVIIDFGFAKNLEAPPLTLLYGPIYGTPSYIPPEQWEDFKSVVPATDIYAYGAMIYEMVTGTVPFTGINYAEVMHKHLSHPVPEVMAVNPNAPPGIQKVIEKAMEKIPGKRYQNPGEFLDSLKALKENKKKDKEKKDKRSDKYTRKLVLLFLSVAAAIIVFVMILKQTGTGSKNPGKPHEIIQTDSQTGAPSAPDLKTGSSRKPTNPGNDSKPGGKNQGRIPPVKVSKNDNKITPKARIEIRSHYLSLNDATVKTMLKKHGFFDRNKNPTGTFSPDCVLKIASGYHVVVGKTTGLMWHPAGSDKPMKFEAAQQWVEELNRKGYAGYTDWRLPTLEEAASLLEKGEKNGRYINTVFSGQQFCIWTADPSGKAWTWTVNFREGRVHWNHVDSNNYVRPVRSMR